MSKPEKKFKKLLLKKLPKISDNLLFDLMDMVINESQIRDERKQND